MVSSVTVKTPSATKFGTVGARKFRNNYGAQSRWVCADREQTQLMPWHRRGVRYNVWSNTGTVWRVCGTMTWRHICSGRRGTKRKAEAQADEEKPSVEEKKDRGEGEDGQQGQRVVIEHWWVLLPAVGKKKPGYLTLTKVINTTFTTLNFFFDNNWTYHSFWNYNIMILINI